MTMPEKTKCTFKGIKQKHSGRVPFAAWLQGVDILTATTEGTATTAWIKGFACRSHPKTLRATEGKPFLLHIYGNISGNFMETTIFPDSAFCQMKAILRFLQWAPLHI